MIGDRELRASVDRYLGAVRAQAEAEITQALRNALARGEFSQGGAEAAVALTCDKIGLNVTVYGKIDL